MAEKPHSARDRESPEEDWIGDQGSGRWLKAALIFALCVVLGLVIAVGLPVLAIVALVSLFG